VSRIEEALRRADRVVGDGVARQDVFVSAWPSGDAEAPAAPIEPKAPPVNAAPAAAPAEIKSTRRFFDPRWREVLALPDGSPLMVEQFRRLAATLHQAGSANGIRRVMVTSAASGDGKTLTSLNLALVLSESYRRRVLLVEADLRRPSLRNFIDLAETEGLSEGLRDDDHKLAVVEVTPTLTVLPAGRTDPDPIVGLSSPRLHRVMEEAAKRFDWVVVDAPPMGAVADASLIAEHVDGVLFVIRAGETQHDAIQRAIDIVGRERIVGVVLNGLDQLPESYGYAYVAEPQKTSSWV
jgi:capsular exopolysaccharide synthesis family protein